MYYYVDKLTGKDSNNGLSQKTAFSTINRAIGFLVPGDVILIKPGIYDERLYIDKSGTKTDYIQIRAFNIKLGRPKITDSSKSGADTIRVAGNYIKLYGLDVDAPGSSGNAIAVGHGSPSNVPIIHHVIIDSCLVHDAALNGIGCSRTDYMTITNNIAYRNAFRDGLQGSGISIYQARMFDNKIGFHNVISGNKCFFNDNKFLIEGKYTTDGNGIIIDDFRQTQDPNYNIEYTASTLIKDNVVFGNGGRGIHVFQSDNVTIRTNTVFSNVRSKVLTGTLNGNMSTYFSSGNTFIDNIVVSDSGEDCLVDGYSEANIWDYNYILGNLNFGDNSKVTPGKNNVRLM